MAPFDSASRIYTETGLRNQRNINSSAPARSPTFFETTKNGRFLERVPFSAARNHSTAPCRPTGPYLMCPTFRRSLRWRRDRSSVELTFRENRAPKREFIKNSAPERFFDPRAGALPGTFTARDLHCTGPLKYEESESVLISTIVELLFEKIDPEH
jgi:hypothetical protein